MSTQIGCITLDNATNNDTFMEKLEAELQKRSIPFDKKAWHIRSVYWIYYNCEVNGYVVRCFLHIVNLACKAVISAMSNINYAHEPLTEDEHESFLEAVKGDPIATLRAAIRVVQCSFYLQALNIWYTILDQVIFSATSMFWEACFRSHPKRASTALWYGCLVVINIFYDWLCHLSWSTTHGDDPG